MFAQWFVCVLPFIHRGHPWCIFACTISFSISKLSNLLLFFQKSGDMKYQNPLSGNRWDECINEPCKADHKIVRLGNQIGGVGNMEMGSGHVLSNSVVLQNVLMQNDIDHVMHTRTENFYDSSKVNGSLKVIPGTEVASENSGLSQFVSPSITSFSSGRYVRCKYLIKILWCEYEVDALFLILSYYSLLLLVQTRRRFRFMAQNVWTGFDWYDWCK